MTAIYAVTTRGLEAVCAAEIQALSAVATEVTSLTYRRVEAEFLGPAAALLSLRTVDDVFVQAASWSDITHEHSALADMEARSEDLELEDALAVVREVRAVADQPVFAVTANYVGKRNYSSEEIKLAVARGITRAYGWHYAALDPKADLNLRVFVEHDRAYIGVRLAAEPLHRRAYKVAQVPGSLRPTVAAAMLSLGGAEPGDVVLDPACGAGTVLIEAAELGATALGGDVDMAALAAAATNISRAGAPVGLARWNARRLPLPAGAVGRVVTNLPWGRQVQVDSQLATFYREASQEIERVLAPGGRAVLLTSEPELLCLQSLALLMTVEISLHGQRPVIAIYDKL